MSVDLRLFLNQTNVLAVTMRKTTNTLSFFVAFINIWSISEAFAGLSSPQHPTSYKTARGLMARSLQIPENIGSLKSTWYDEVNDPTARRQIYDE